jgi:hypothetical protein
MAQVVSRQCWKNKAIVRVGGALGAPCKKRDSTVKPSVGLEPPQTLNISHPLPLINRHANQPNQAYVGDITSIPTAEGWLYLTVVIDLNSFF